MTDRLLAAGLARCRDHGLAVSQPDDGGEPPGIARPAGHHSTTPPTVAGVVADRAIAVEPIREADPTTVLSRLWNDRNNDRLALFVTADERTAEAVESLLTAPVGVQSADEEGRVFYNGPDRIPVAEGGYAAVPAGTSVRWRESAGPLPEPAGLVAADAEDSPAPSDHDGVWLTLLADDDPLVRLDGLDALASPPRERFPYAYQRDRDKQIRVVDFAGRPVERYTGIRAMRNGGFQPVPAPLVPDHMFDEPIDGRWSVVVAD